ncbi:hypothetical protein [Nostoc sp. FACHB-133]|uniref:hypothetical protein n=1 Tax=Nostoc sp. FACHB-133 TaxID=2692835 RepID=UPI0016861F7E|nr:hypothetical protein [Nostoc sp. FACHB-133]MBD2527407.1 hypothetical protein [Nostoc sp. FACHB-133]
MKNYAGVSFDCLTKASFSSWTPYSFNNITMKSPILFKTLTLLSFSLPIPLTMIANVPVIANTLNTPTNTEQPKRLKLTLSGHTAPVRALTL